MKVKYYKKIGFKEIVVYTKLVRREKGDLREKGERKEI